MGQHFSCVDKNKSGCGDGKTTRIKEKKSSKKNAVDNKHNEVESAHTEIRTHASYLTEAPYDFKLPEVAPLVKKTEKDGISPLIEQNSQRISGDISNISPKVHKNHPVDMNARHLAQGEMKPRCWKDLYWHLIGSRGFTTDEEKVCALFSWLSSTPLAEIFSLEQDSMGENINKFEGKHLQSDSPDIVLSKLSNNKANYVQAFESMCRYSDIPCITIRGIAKSTDYKVGQTLLPPGQKSIDIESGALPPRIASLQHSWNAAYVDNSWKLFDVTWAAQRLSRVNKSTKARTSQAMTQQYEFDMFYYETDPLELIYTHYPFEDAWQLIDPPISIEQFATWPLVKPALFQNGLCLFSHQEGSIPSESKLVLKIKMIPENVRKIMFTYQLNLEGHGNLDSTTARTRFGMHEISPDEAMAIFRFRLPKKGEYSLIIYARYTGEELFSDVCEYHVSAMGANNGEVLDVLPFPPTAQSSYGPTEKANEYGLETLPRQLNPLITSQNGSLELRFIAAEPGCKIPKLTARLKSLNLKECDLENCILLREIEATLPTTGVSFLTGIGSCVPMTVLNAYLPEKGEYALEVYAAPPSVDEPTSYHLAWQFLVQADTSKPLSTDLRGRLATLNLGAQDESWQKLGFRTLSHPDPLVRVRTAGRIGSEKLLKLTSKAQVLQRFTEASIKGDLLTNRSQIDGQDEMVANISITKADGDVRNVDDDEAWDPEVSDLSIILGLPELENIFLISQLVDISGSEEEDVTGYLIQRTQDIIDRDDDFPGDRTSKGTSLDMNFDAPSKIASIFVRIPRGGSFYKLYLYAVAGDGEKIGSIPLVYTYLIDAPLRLAAAETPYIGALAGEFPEKIAKRKMADGTASGNLP